MSHSGSVGVVEAVAAPTGSGRALATSRVTGTDEREYQQHGNETYAKDRTSSFDHKSKAYPSVC
jgi:hypothetical protein